MSIRQNYPTVARSYVQSLIDTTLSEGVELNELLEGIALTASDLAKPNFRLHLTEMTRLWLRAVELTDNPMLGLYVGEDIQLGSLHVFGPLAMNSPSLAKVIEYLVQYASIISEGGRMSFHRDENYCSIEYTPYDGLELPITPYQIEGTFSTMVHVSRQIVVRDIPPVAMYFRHAAPGDVSEYVRIFRCPVFFEAAKDELRLLPEALDLPIKFADPTLLSHHEAIANNILGSISESAPLAAQIKRMIHRVGAMECSPEKVAQALNLSLRSVQRKLKAENTSYQDLLDDYRREQSAALLASTDLPIIEIAEKLGYLNLSSFHRAFQRWYQVAPAKYRKTTS